jgi:hypothetical protein
LITDVLQVPSPPCATFLQPNPRSERTQNRAPELSFVPVVGATDAPPAATSAAPVGIIDVALGGAIVRVPPEVDGKLLAKVLRAVKSVA